MKTRLLFLLLASIFISCTSSKNSPEFINNATGRYFFNADEVIEVYFDQEKLFLKWRGKDLEPMKVNDSTFYVSEMNEKLVFNTTKNKIELAQKREHKDNKYVFSKLKENEKTPSEYLADNDYEMALKGYLAIQEKDSLSPVIDENTINSTGYRHLRNDEFNKAINLFRINTVLYPKSSNTFDSLGDAFLRKKDTAEAIINYQKALEINPENKSSKKNLEKLTKKE
ncbi:TolA-binding protein [Tenacibaculum adriaticum]|uniref:TolA-binding protein n=1 Tax=Tenacibaculum adriaticum TaxID=413713 RepID=A0A5S5DSQ2_9FLAO|nr:tetratricopeptide repeat protein [Tenacibaculum adriaticum]TYP98805.1 TolA-binding protein [Tenacibaculum adriaticum]